jgi:hypothetical protein
MHVSNITPPHEVKIADEKRSLDELEYVAVAAHGRITCLEGDMARLDRERLPLAMKAGDALIEIVSRKLIKHGQRTALYARTCGSIRTGQIYVLLAEHRALIESNAQRSAFLSIAGALRLIRKHNGTTKPKPATKASSSVYASAFGKLSNTEKTAALAEIGFAAVWQVLPRDFYPQIESRLATALFNRAKAAQPNTKLKRFRPRSVLDAEAALKSEIAALKAADASAPVTERGEAGHA